MVGVCSLVLVVVMMLLVVVVVVVVGEVGGVSRTCVGEGVEEGGLPGVLIAEDDEGERDAAGRDGARER